MVTKINLKKKYTHRSVDLSFAEVFYNICWVFRVSQLICQRSKVSHFRENEIRQNPCDPLKGANIHSQVQKSTFSEKSHQFMRFYWKNSEYRKDKTAIRLYKNIFNYVQILTRGVKLMHISKHWKNYLLLQCVEFRMLINIFL